MKFAYSKFTIEICYFLTTILISFLSANFAMALGRGGSSSSVKCDDGREPEIIRTGRTTQVVCPPPAKPYRRGICSIDESTKKSIESCLRQINQDICDGIPLSQKRDCYDLKTIADKKGDFAQKCGSGVVSGFVAPIKGMAEVFTKSYEYLQSPKKYDKKVRSESYIKCDEKLKIKRQLQMCRDASKNVGAEVAQASCEKYNQEYFLCLQEEQQKGRPINLDISLPDAEEIQSLYSCLSPESQFEIACSVVVPGLVTGVGGAALVRLAKSRLNVFHFKKLVKSEVAKRLVQLEKNPNLSTAERLSISHQLDLLDYLQSSEIVDMIKSMKMDSKSLINGVIDSDLGKLDAYRKLYTEPSYDSNRLLKALQGKDNTTVSGRAMQELFKENSMQPLIKDLPLDQVRAVYKDIPALLSYHHDGPGMIDLIHALDNNQISIAEFKRRALANLNHNNFNSGFGLQLGDFVVLGLKNSKLNQAKEFLKGTYYEGKTVEGVVTPKYDMPKTKEGLLHAIGDRISGGTGDGDIKFFYEIVKPQLSSNPEITMGAIKFGNPPTNGIGVIRQLLNDVAERKTRSNANLTMDQFNDVEKFIKNEASFLSSTDRSKFFILNQAAKQRQLAKDAFMQPPNVEFILDANQVPVRINFKTPESLGGKYIGSISVDTPANEAMAISKKFFEQERRLNGNPMTDLLKPRLLTAKEVALVGFPSASAYMYCNLEDNFANGVLKTKHTGDAVK